MVKKSRLKFLSPKWREKAPRVTVRCSCGSLPPSRSLASPTIVSRPRTLLIASAEFLRHSSFIAGQFWKSISLNVIFVGLINRSPLNIPHLIQNEVLRNKKLNLINSVLIKNLAVQSMPHDNVISE